jgi:hypothetical protein
VEEVKVATDPDGFKSALARIQGENYDHYVRPTPEQLAEDALFRLKTYFQKLPSVRVVVMERVTFNALQTHQGDWLASHVDMNSAIHVRPNHRLALYRSKSDHRLVVHSSFFLMFAVKVPTLVRIRAVRDFITLLDLLCAIGHVTQEEVTRQRNILQAFLMGLEGLDGGDLAADLVNDDEDLEGLFGDDQAFDLVNEDEDLEEDVRSYASRQYYRARNNAMPHGYFRPPLPGTLVVSKHLKIGHSECFYIRNELGEDQFSKLLEAHGFCGCSPLEPEYKCSGHSAVPGRAARACTAPLVLKEGRWTPSAYQMVSKKASPFFGKFFCYECYNKLRFREVAVLEEQQGSGAALSPAQLELLQSRHAEEELRRERSKKHNAKWGNTVSRFFARKQLYPDAFQKWLTHGVELYVRIKGIPKVCSSSLVTLCDQLIEREEFDLIEGFKIGYKEGKFATYAMRTGKPGRRFWRSRPCETGGGLSKISMSKQPWPTPSAIATGRLRIKNSSTVPLR